MPGQLFFSAVVMKSEKAEPLLRWKVCSNTCSLEWLSLVPCTVDIHYSRLYLVHFLVWLSQISWFLSENSDSITGVLLLERSRGFVGDGSKWSLWDLLWDKSVEENGRKGFDLAVIPSVETTLHFCFLSPFSFPNCNTPGDKAGPVKSLGNGHWDSSCVWSQEPYGCKVRKLNLCLSKKKL